MSAKSEVGIKQMLYTAHSVPVTWKCLNVCKIRVF